MELRNEAGLRSTKNNGSITKTVSCKGRHKAANWRNIKLLLLVLVCSLFFQPAGMAYADDAALSVEIGPSNSYVILESSRIKVQYAPFNSNTEFAIMDFIIKGAGNEDQVGSGIYDYLEADSFRGTLSSAEIIHDDVDYKTVRLIWNDKIGSHTITHEVSIYPHSTFLKIDYIDTQYGGDFIDLGNPGGTGNGTHVFYGGDSWVRDYVTWESEAISASYYNRYPADLINDPADGGSLNYNDHFIMGVYNSANDRGFARVMPIADTDIIKLMLTSTSRRGFEIFPHPFFLLLTPAFTGYLYAVTGGEAEIMSVGQQLADGDLVQAPAYQLTVNTVGSGSGDVNLNPPGGIYEGDTVVELTPNPDAGSAFNGWAGGLTGFSNPTTIIMNADKTITATFDTDTDLDGISDNEEGAGPNGGDGNEDLILDSAQDNVASFHTEDGADYVTLESAAGTTLANCRAVTPPNGGPSGIDFQNGFFGFTVNGLVAGAATTVTLYLHNGDTPTTYYKYGSTPVEPVDHWYEFLYDGETGAEINGNVITLHFVDGKRGDDDLAENGTIVDDGGPGVASSGGDDDDDDGGGGGGGGGCFIATVSQ